MVDDDPAFITRYRLSDVELAAIDRVLDDLLRGADAIRVEDLLLQLHAVAVKGLPAGVVDLLERLRLLEVPPVLVISGFPVDDEAIGPTPLHWRHAENRVGREALHLVLLSSVLGELVGWESLQAGRLVHNVLPIPSEEHEQSGHGSLTPLEWHTEDCFHPFRCDYLGLMAMRNHDRVATTLSSIDSIELSAREMEVLAAPRFVIRPDDEHIRQFVDINSRSKDRNHAWSEPQPVTVIWGDRRQPYLRLDPTFMSAVPHDDEAEAVLHSLVHRLDATLHPLVLEAGSVCFVDNYRTVHGRNAFRARFDGTDRWLKKVLVTRDLRKSRAVRQGANERVMSFALDAPTALSAPLTEVVHV
jgi:Fe(II)/alpha-ketoglutarate-dependent arginine beta-hydroxylase